MDGLVDLLKCKDLISTARKYNAWQVTYANVAGQWESGCLQIDNCGARYKLTCLLSATV